MPMNFLVRIEDASFPLPIHEEADVQCAAVLAAAGLIEASLPDPEAEAGHPGLILRITALGRAELSRMRDPGP